MSQKGQLPEHLKNHQPNFGPIGETVFRRTYSLVKADGTKETWPDTVVRTVDGNLGLVNPEFIEPDERNKLIELLLKFGALPAGRHLNASGVKGRQFLFNCHASGFDALEPSAHFSFMFDQLMQGGGVGANYSNRYLKSMPPVHKSIDIHVVCREDHPNHSEFSQLLSKHTGLTENAIFVVEDSREGWVQCVDFLFREAFNPRPSLFQKNEVTITVDVSKIRARGLPLKTSGGIACGPAPLVTMVTDLAKHLNSCVGRHLSTLDAMTIDHAMASCVVAGGKRRSSRMSVKNWQDPDIFEFINCKREDGSHWTTNISVEVDDAFFVSYNNKDEHAKAVMRAITLGKRSNGEPGVWNRSLSMVGERNPELMYCPNPCGEIGLQMWEACNLGHINMEYFAKKPQNQMYEAFRLMTRWLIRATFGDVPQPRQREVLDANRRIGVGFFGFHAWLALRDIKYSDCHNNFNVQAVMAECKNTVAYEAYRYAQQLQIPTPVKTTALAPTGTIVHMAGTTPGGQAMPTVWFKRLVRYSDLDPELAVKRSEGYEVFPDEDAANTSIVVYWCEDPLAAKVRAAGLDPAVVLESQYDISFETSLKVQAMLQTHYADNAISYTVNLRPEDMGTEEEMEAALIKHMPTLKGTTVFPEKSRKNSPIQPLTKAQFDAYQGQKQVTQIEDECKNGCPVR